MFLLQGVPAILSESSVGKWHALQQGGREEGQGIGASSPKRIRWKKWPREQLEFQGDSIEYRDKAGDWNN